MDNGSSSGGENESTTLYLRGVPTELAREAKAVAARRGITLTALVIDGLRRSTGLEGESTRELPDQLRHDAAWYRDHKDELLERHRGEYLAILDAEVVDHDADFDALARRVFGRLGPRPILMPRCLPEPRVAEMRSPRVVGR